MDREHFLQLIDKFGSPLYVYDTSKLISLSFAKIESCCNHFIEKISNHRRENCFILIFIF